MASATGQQIYYARPVKVIDPTQSQLMTGKCQSLCKESNEKLSQAGNSNYDTQDKRKPSGSAPVLPPRIKTINAVRETATGKIFSWNR